MSVRAAQVTAQAKVNLFLRVLAREQGGFHQVETLLARVDLGDLVRVHITAGARSLDCDGPMLPSGGLGAPEENLAWRAAELYAIVAEWPAGFAIEIEKRIPVGGGLGGGSADAGAVLRALDALNPEPVGPLSLLQMAARLGSDVPFLTSREPLALAWGRGERMLALPALPPRHVVLVVPPYPVSTADAYRWLAAARVGEQGVTGPMMRHLPELASWEGVDHAMRNDFQLVVSERHPDLADLARALVVDHGARRALLGGSGSTVFGLFDTPPDATAIARATGYSVLPTRTSARVVEVELTD